MLSLRAVLPKLPLAAALSSNHLGAVLFPTSLRVFYILYDRYPAGDAAVECLSARAKAARIQPVPLTPIAGDFNDDLHRLGPQGLLAQLLPQLVPGHLARFGTQPS